MVKDGLVGPRLEAMAHSTAFCISLGLWSGWAWEEPANLQERALAQGPVGFAPEMLNSGKGVKYPFKD